MINSLLRKHIDGLTLVDSEKSLGLGVYLGRATFPLILQFLTGISVCLLISCDSGSDSAEAAQPNIDQPVTPPTLLPSFELVSPVPQIAVFNDSAVDLVVSLTGELGDDLTIEWISDLQGLLSDEQSSTVMLDPGFHTISVTFRTASTAGLLNFQLPVVRRADAFEALIVGTGRLSINPSACGRVNEWTSFPLGSQVTISIPSTLPDDKKEIVLSNAQIANSITSGQLSVEVREVSSTVIEFSQDHISVVEHTSPSEVGCINDFACTFWSFNDDRSMSSSIVVLRPDQPMQVVGHELGHALFGLCHIAGDQIGGESSTMSAPTARFFSQSAGTLTELDSTIVTSIYTSGLSPGATSTEMLALGLIQE